MSTINYFLETADAGHDFIDMLLSDELAHDGTKRKSGRYRWGEGARPYQHEPQKREMYLTMKNYGSTFGKANGFSKEISDKTSRLIVDTLDSDFINVTRSPVEMMPGPRDKTVSYNIDTSSIGSNNKYTSYNNPSKFRADVKPESRTVSYNIDTSSIGSNNKYTSYNNPSKFRADVKPESRTVSYDSDTSSINSNDNYNNSKKKKYGTDTSLSSGQYLSPSVKAGEDFFKSVKDKKYTQTEPQKPKSIDSNQNDSETTKKDIWARTEKGGKDKPSISLAERTARDVKSTTDDLINGTTKILNNMKSNRKMKNNAKGLSNDELRERIARIRLEKEYNQLTSNDVNTGYDKTMRVLSALGTAVSVGAGVVSIVAGVKNMKSVGKNGQ